MLPGFARRLACLRLLGGCSLFPSKSALRFTSSFLIFGELLRFLMRGFFSKALINRPLQGCLMYTLTVLVITIGKVFHIISDQVPLKVFIIIYAFPDADIEVLL